MPQFAEKTEAETEHKHLRVVSNEAPPRHERMTPEQGRPADAEALHITGGTHPG